MIDFRKLSPADRRTLAASQYGELPARDIPHDWKQRIVAGIKVTEAVLITRGVIASRDEDTIPPLDDIVDIG